MQPFPEDPQVQKLAKATLRLVKFQNFVLWISVIAFLAFGVLMLVVAGIFVFG